MQCGAGALRFLLLASHRYVWVLELAVVLPECVAYVAAAPGVAKAGIWSRA